MRRYEVILVSSLGPSMLSFERVFLKEIIYPDSPTVYQSFYAKQCFQMKIYQRNISPNPTTKSSSMIL